jgi:cell division protein FtsI (penicillin-binding protein 3)
VAARTDLVDVRRLALVEAKWRVRWVQRAFLLVGLGAMAQIAHLGIQGKAPAEFSLSDQLLPERGDIVDRNGVPLARAFPAYSLWFNPKIFGPKISGKDVKPLVKTPAELAAALVRIFPDMDEATLTAQLASGRAGYLRRRILPEEANRVHVLGEPALEFPRENERYYPQSSLAAMVLGYIDPDGHAQVGMERVLDHQLSDKATRGTPAVLSIDARVQGALEDELAKGIRDSNAKGGGGIVLDVDTGEVLALASLPTFNPNQPRLYGANGDKLMRNRMSSEVYELGSVFKPITVATALEAGTITSLARRFPAGGQRKIDGRIVHDDKDFGPSLNVPEALVHSSNIVLAQIGDEIGGVRLSGTLRSLGFDKRPMLELPARGQPHWPTGAWTPVTTSTVAFGHGVSVTPLHVASAYAALVNGGVWHPATLTRHQPGDVVPSTRIWNAATSAKIRQLLRMIVEVGTGRHADAPGFRVGGKTGTAEIADRGGYHKDRVVTTFAAAFPMDHPRYVVLAMMEEPQRTTLTSGQRTAAWNAAPVVGRVVPRIGPLLGIMPDPTHDVDVSDVKPLVPDGEGE